MEFSTPLRQDIDREISRHYLEQVNVRPAPIGQFKLARHVTKKRTKHEF